MVNKILFLNKEAWWTSKLMVALLFKMLMNSSNAEKHVLMVFGYLH